MFAMKDQPNQQPHQAIRVSPLFNLLDYNIKINDVCWNQVKMTSSKWISCFHRIYQSNNNNHNHNRHHRGSTPSPFNTFSGRRHHPNHHHHHHLQNSHRWPSPSMQSDNNSFQSFIMNQSPINSSSFYSSSSTSASGDWNVDPSQSSSSSSSRSSIRSIPFPTTPIRPLPPHHQQHSTSKIRDLPHPIARNPYPYPNPQNQFCSKDDSMMMSMMRRDRSLAQQLSIQSVITLINPFEYLLINCETNLDTNCAQISPEQDIIAVSNEYWLAFYSIRDNDCFGTVQFPNKCLYWTWINSDSVAIITEDDVYHWSLMNPNVSSLHDHAPKMIFSLNEDFKQYQIIDYCIDPLYGYWSALTSLYLDDDEICGKVQIYSKSYGLSQCIDAHVATFVGYRFEGSANDSILLIACKRDTIHLWKLYIIELSAMANPNSHYKNRPIKSQHLMLHGFQRTMNFSHNHNHEQEQEKCPNETTSPQSSSSTTSNQTSIHFDDIPTHIVCDNYIGLIFIVSKYGSIYICDLETGIPLYYDTLTQFTENLAIFSISYDSKNSCLLAICRNGRVLVIKILLKKLLEHKKLQSNIRNRISQRVHCRKLLRMSSIPNNATNDYHENNDEKNLRTVSISVNNNNNNNSRKKSNDNEHSKQSSNIIIDDSDEGVDSNRSDQTSIDNRPASFYIDQDDLVEEITRL